MLTCNYCAGVNIRGTHCSSCRRALELQVFQQDALIREGYSVRRLNGDPPNWEWVNERLTPGHLTHSTLQATALDAWVLAWHHWQEEPAQKVEVEEPIPTFECRITLIGDDHGFEWPSGWQSLTQTEFMDCMRSLWTNSVNFIVEQRP